MLESGGLARPPDSSPASMFGFSSFPERLRARWHVFLLVAFGIVVWSNSFTAPFVFDDRPAILANPTLDRFATALIPPRDGGTVAGRPAVNLSLWLNRAMSGEAEWSYHALNLLLHLCAALTLYALVRRTVALRSALPPDGGSARGLDKGSVAFAAALLWMVHPLQTAAITYTVQRAEALMALCMLVTLYGFSQAVGADRPPGSGRCWRLIAFTACLVGMSAKEVMVVAPVLVLLYDRAFVSGSIVSALRKRWRLHAALAATWVWLGWLVATNDSRSGTAGYESGVDPIAYMLTQSEAILHYLRLALWPGGLVFDYGTDVVRGVGSIRPPAVFLIVLLATTAVWIWRNTLAGFLGAAFFLILAPSSSVVPVATQTVAEHRMYLPLAALTIGLAVLLNRVLSGRAVALTLTLALPLAFTAFLRNTDYSSALQLWHDTVAKRPGNPRAHMHLGNALTHAGLHAAALKHYETAANLEPGNASHHANLANALAAAGRLPEALSQYREALALSPNVAVIELNYAQALARADQHAEAVLHYAAAARLGPMAPSGHFNYGVALVRTGQLSAAVAEFQATLRQDRSHVGAWVNLGNVLLLSGRPAEAVASHEAALRLRPDDPQIGRNLARARAILGAQQHGSEARPERVTANPEP